MNGLRVRRNFRTWQEASTEEAALERNAISAALGLRSAVTCLADDQLRETEAVFRRLQGNPRSLAFWV